MIEFKNASKTFTLGKREVHAVKDVSLSLKKVRFLESSVLAALEKAHYFA